MKWSLVERLRFDYLAFGLPPKGGLPPNPSIFISPQASHQLNLALQLTTLHQDRTAAKNRQCSIHCRISELNAIFLQCMAVVRMLKLTGRLYFIVPGISYLCLCRWTNSLWSNMCSWCVSSELCYYVLVDYCLTHTRSWPSGRWSSRKPSLTVSETTQYVQLPLVSCIVSLF